MALVLKETICLRTPLGRSEVQLLFGDITQLPLEEKVDTLFVSAFPGDYVAVPNTLIGSLKRHLGVIVKELAGDKALDLRRNFNCWVSKKLPKHIPFGRLVCFERINHNERLSEQISGMFRAMMPVFNNQDTTVITPLLAAGNQGHSSEEVLRAIVKAACHWIKAGLPLRCLKIVVYMQNTNAASESDVKLLQMFSQYKKKWETDSGAEVNQKKKYDVCLSYSKGDESMVNMICNSLQSESTHQITIYKEGFTYNHDAVWQEQIFSVMVDSYKILVVLSPNYVDKPECLEQFNLALCCNRQRGDVLAPFYMQTVPSFPSYMTLIQYTECRVRKEGEVAEEKVTTACAMLIKQLDIAIQQQQEQPALKSDQAKAEKSLENADAYDVFISYAHRTPTEAMTLFETLQCFDPDLKIFFDRSELKTGNIWQETLYKSVENARLVVAFISQSYIKSTVCQEEYNIALARFLTKDGVYLVPMLTEDITEVPPSFALTPFVDLRDVPEDNQKYNKIAKILIQYLRTMNPDHRFSKPSKKVDMLPALDQRRQLLFQQNFEMDQYGIIRLKSATQTTQMSDVESISRKTVLLCFASDCLHQGTFLCHLLKSQSAADIRVEFLTSQLDGKAQAPKLSLLDSADMVVVIVSDDYMASAQHRNELHIALCRQRTTKDRPVLYLIESHHSRPTPMYSHILPHNINLGDKHWFSQARKAGKLKSTESVMVKLPGDTEMRVQCSGLEYMALQTAAADIADKLAKGDASGDSGIPVNILNLASVIGKEDAMAVEKCSLPFSTLEDEITENPELAIQEMGENTRYRLQALESLRMQAEIEKELFSWDKQSSKRRSKLSSTCNLL